jgi:predicted unusual protein kinase regulating ubiquinone biosynthesis (AarF/ABC1/UbiB family)
VTDIPRRTAARTAKLASLPLGVAGRAAAGGGRRLAGGDGDEISAQLMAKSAEQLFAVLGELKGGAMKFGQALSVFEAAIPDEFAAPFRESLVKLQSAAPPMRASEVHRMLAEQFGRGWRERFREFDETPAAAASIGQVHRAVWRDGREVAVKVQYPGAGEALRSDLRQLSRMSRLIQPLVPGLEIKPLIAELRDRMEEELDYRDEAANQRIFAAAYDGDDKVKVPRVVASAPRAMVTEWVTGRRLSDVIRSGTQAERDGAAALLAEFHYSAPARVGLLHADPHPGNFQILDDGRLMVLDFGAVARLPDGHPEPIGRLSRLAIDGQADEVLDGLRAEGFVKGDVQVDAQAILDFVRPMLEPIMVEEFRLTRAWLRGEAGRLANPRGPAFQLSRSLNLPPSYMLIHRVTLGSIGVLCQLEAKAPYRSVVERWLPGFAEPSVAVS